MSVEKKREMRMMKKCEICGETLVEVEVGVIQCPSCGYEEWDRRQFVDRKPGRPKKTTFGVKLSSLDGLVELKDELKGVKVKGYVLTDLKFEFKPMTIEERLKKIAERRKEALRKAAERRQKLRELAGERQDEFVRRQLQKEKQRNYEKACEAYYKKFERWINYESQRLRIPVNKLSLVALGVIEVEPVVEGEWYEFPNLKFKVDVTLKDGKTLRVYYGTLKKIVRAYRYWQIDAFPLVVEKEKEDENGGNE